MKGYKLFPYRTIAVDKNHIAYGSVVFIPDAVGTEILKKDGKTFLHDGYFFAGDTGAAIKTNHIDVFTGIEAIPFLSLNQLRSRNSRRISLLMHQLSRNCWKRINNEGIKRDIDLKRDLGRITYPCCGSADTCLE